MQDPSDRGDWAQGPGRYSAGYDHDDRHFRFQRSHSGELETSAPMSGYGADLLAFTGIVLCVAMLWALAWLIS